MAIRHSIETTVTITLCTILGIALARCLFFAIVTATNAIHAFAVLLQ